MSTIGLSKETLHSLSEEDKKELRKMRFKNDKSSDIKEDEPRKPRVAHPGGPLITNKAAALARFLQRKIAAGQGSSLDPALVEKAIENAKASLAPQNSDGENTIRHLNDMERSDDSLKIPHKSENKKKKQKLENKKLLQQYKGRKQKRKNKKGWKGE